MTEDERLLPMPAPSEATGASSSESAAWSRVSRLLEHAGFAPLALHMTEDAEGVLPIGSAQRTVVKGQITGYQTEAHEYVDDESGQDS